MFLSFRCAVTAVALLVLSFCQVASAQISLGLGTTAHRDAEARILRQLESRDAFVFTDMPLANFAQALRERFGINVVIDGKSLDDFGIDSATPISIHLRDAALESCLDLVLESLDLAWTIRHEALVITTLETAEERLETRIYPVRDLVLIERERTVEADFDNLTWMITSTIEPNSWNEVGGPGAVEPETGSLSLVISQTWRAHRQIEPLLRTLRAAREMQGITPVRIGSIRGSVAKQPREYRGTGNSAWQQPRVYEH